MSFRNISAWCIRNPVPPVVLFILLLLPVSLLALTSLLGQRIGMARTGRRISYAAVLGDQRMRRSLVEAINKLPEREQHVMSMYYEHDMNLKEIAAVLGVTESRICQLHSQSIARLRSKLREH